MIARIAAPAPRLPSHPELRFSVSLMPAGVGHLPRIAHHAVAPTLGGQLNMRKFLHAEDLRTIDEECTCYAYARFRRAYVRHLVKANEI